MKARYPSSRDCFKYRIKSDEMKDIGAGEEPPNQSILDAVSAGVTGRHEGIEDDKTE
jgi:hypothetical protein